MTGALHQKPSKPPINDAFTSDLIAHRARERFGGLGNWEYSKPRFGDPNDPVRGAQLWGEFLHNTPAYYILNAEIQLAERVANMLPQFIDEPVSLHFLGIGTPDIFAQKDLTVTEQFNQVASVSVYDMNIDYINAAYHELEKATLEVKDRTMHVINFFEQNLRLYDPKDMRSMNARRVATMFGGTLLNLEGRTMNGPPERQAIERLTLMRRSVVKGGYFIVSQDANDNPEKIVKAYEGQGEFACNLGHLINRDTPYQVDTTRTRFNVQFHSNAHVLAHYLTLDFEDIGERRIHFNNSYKIPTAQFIQWAEAAGFAHVHTETEDGVNLHVLEARL
jgi:uncharacterized SAM-dependent methyltransferase